MKLQAQAGEELEAGEVGGTTPRAVGACQLGPVCRRDLADGSVILGPRFADLSMNQGGTGLVDQGNRIVLKVTSLRSPWRTGKGWDWSRNQIPDLLFSSHVTWGEGLSLSDPHQMRIIIG